MVARQRGMSVSQRVLVWSACVLVDSRCALGSGALVGVGLSTCSVGVSQRVSRCVGLVGMVVRVLVGVFV